MKAAYRSAAHIPFGLAVGAGGFVLFTLEAASTRPVALRTILFLGALAWGTLGGRLAWAGAYPMKEGLKILNPFHTSLFPWPSIERIELGEYLLIPMAFVVLLNGSRFHIYGIEGTPGVGRATALIKELNELVIRRREEAMGGRQT